MIIFFWQRIRDCLKVFHLLSSDVRSYLSGCFQMRRQMSLFPREVIEIRNTLYTNILSTLLLSEGAVNFSLSSLQPPPHLIFVRLLSLSSAFVPSFRIQDAVSSKSNYYGGTLGVSEGAWDTGGENTCRCGEEYSLVSCRLQINEKASAL
jgi:hypothetical protein